MADVTFNHFPAFRTSCEVCGKVHRVQFVFCCRMLSANFLRKFQLWYILKRSWGLGMHISGLYNISLRLLLDEKQTRVNGLAGKRLSTN